MNEHFKSRDLETRVRLLEEEMALLKGDPRFAESPYGAPKEAKSVLSLRSVGGANGGAYPAGLFHLDLYPSVSAASVANVLMAIPFYLPDVPNLVTKMGIRVATGATGNIRLGIYGDKGEAMLYPGRLLLDAGAVSTATAGVKSLTVRQNLPRGLVWVALLASSSTPEIRYFTTSTQTWALLGFSESGAYRYTHYRVSQAFGSLPNPFPAGATEDGMLPFVWLKFG